jgi:hypothetical protein
MFPGASRASWHRIARHMRIFIGYGYNARDAWIERDVFPILQGMNLEIVHGKDMYGEELRDEVKDRIGQADALVAFCTLRQGQRNADFNSHIWVRDELQHAMTLRKPAVEVREKGVRNPPGLVGDRQRIELDPDNRLKCVAELVKVVSNWSMRRLLLVPIDQKQSRRIHQAIATGQLLARYRSRIRGIDSRYREGRIERLDKGLYLNAIGLPELSLVEIEGSTKSDGVIFNTGWASADLVRIEF